MCQKLLCPRKERRLDFRWGEKALPSAGSGHQQSPQACCPGTQLRAETGAGAWPLHSVLGSNSCSYCLAVALRDSLGTIGLTAYPLTLPCWAWQDELQCAKAKSSFSQWQKCLYFLSWTFRNSQVQRDEGWHPATAQGTKLELAKCCLEQNAEWVERCQTFKLLSFFLSFCINNIGIQVCIYFYIWVHMCVYEY